MSTENLASSCLALTAPHQHFTLLLFQPWVFLSSNMDQLFFHPCQGAYQPTLEHRDGGGGLTVKEAGTTLRWLTKDTWAAWFSLLQV